MTQAADEMATGVRTLPLSPTDADIWNFACSVISEGRPNKMTRETILYVSDQATCSDSVSVALEAAGYEVVSTKSTMQAIALLFILHPVAATVLHSRGGEPTSLDVARSLRAVRPDVPIVLLCRDCIDRLPPCVDACVSAREPLTNLTTVLKSLFTAKQADSCENAF
jgi:CheY-like chemotaxis protein